MASSGNRHCGNCIGTLSLHRFLRTAPKVVENASFLGPQQQAYAFSIAFFDCLSTYNSLLPAFTNPGPTSNFLENYYNLV